MGRFFYVIFIKHRLIFIKTTSTSLRKTTIFGHYMARYFSTSLCSYGKILRISHMNRREFRSLQDQYPHWIFCFVVLTKYTQWGFESRTQGLPDLARLRIKKSRCKQRIFKCGDGEIRTRGAFKGLTSLAKKLIRPL